MDQQKKHDIALMRYSAISPIISGLQENYSSLEAFYRDASKKVSSLQMEQSNTLHPPLSKDGTETIAKVVLMPSFRKDGWMKADRESLMMIFRNRSAISK